MRLSGFVGALLTVILIGGAVPAQAQSPPLQAEALRDWTAMKDRMVKIADAMPADKFSFKATPAERTYAEQIMHVVIVDNQILRLLRTSAAAPTSNPNATPKDEVMKALSDSFDFGLAAIRQQTDQTMGQVEQVPQQLQFLGASTRSRLVSFMLGHTWDIYGQMAVYLRLNGIVPPASATP